MMACSMAHTYLFQSLISVDKRGRASGDVKTAACMYNDGGSLFRHDECIDCMHGDAEAFIFYFCSF
jgi:hypothetical protein